MATEISKYGKRKSETLEVRYLPCLYGVMFVNQSSRRCEMWTDDLQRTLFKLEKGLSGAPKFGHT